MITTSNMKTVSTAVEELRDTVNEKIGEEKTAREEVVMIMMMMISMMVVMVILMGVMMRIMS